MILKTMLSQWGRLGIFSLAAVSTAIAAPLPTGANTERANGTVARPGLLDAPIQQEQSSADAVIELLLRSVIERLVISEAVARAKFDKGTPVQDTLREEALLNTIAQQAPQYGVTDAQARAFFRDQIEAGKVVQTVLLARWQRAGEAPGHAVDLVAVLRPRLDRLSSELLAQLGRALSIEPAVPAASIDRARERLAQEYRLNALQRAAFHQATSSLASLSARTDMDANAAL